MKKNRCRSINWIISIIILFCNLSGCMQIADTTKDITLGVAWPFASDTSLFEEGIDLAVNEINENGGIDGNKLILLKSDDASETTRGMSVAQNLSENKSVIAVIGHKSSYVSVPAASIYEEAGLVMLSPASTAPELTVDDGRYIFRIIPSDTVLARNMAEHLADKSYKRFVLFYSDDSYGRGLADSVEDQFKQFGITIVDRFHDYAGTVGLERMKERWRAFDYDGIFVAAAMSQGGQFIQDAGLVGIDTVFAGGNALDSTQLSEFIPDQSSEVVIGSVFDPDSSEQAIRFTQSFIDHYGTEPDIYAALGYDAVNLLTSALDNTKNYSREEVAKELRGIGKWMGVCGMHVFSENGDETGELIVIKQLIDGSFHRLER